MLRAVKVDIRHITAKKRRMIEEIVTQYRAAVNFYIRRFWQGEYPKWNAIMPHTRLSARYVTAAYKQAQEIVRSVTNGRNAHRSAMPVFRGYPISTQNSSRSSMLDCRSSTRYFGCPLCAKAKRCPSRSSGTAGSTTG
ncbi:MAG: hypothetical protein KatS3mg109_0093 [Pirellulaceae bacterium]|nr:MAG: hypothetical protein KatS3mg109_0093 [Pirellulaceae bacterium]